MFSKEEIKNICTSYNIECSHIGEVIDTSMGDNDERYNYQINHKYFLKINNIKSKTEKFLVGMNQLIKNYKSIGVYCPSLYKTKENTFSLNIERDGIKFTCHVEEKSPFQISESQEEVDYEFKKEILGHVGKLASKFTNHNLTTHNSMWSLIELANGDTDVDEKQENFDELYKCLKDNGYTELADKLRKQNDKTRAKIKTFMRDLPRCVYQGDLNNSNILVDEDKKFCGIIDFNMHGTEVNVNCFLNEAMYFLKKKDFEDLLARDIFSKMTSIQNDLMSVITSHYKLSDIEMEIIDDYKRVIFTSFYPNVCLMIDLMKQNYQKEKVIEFLEIISNL